MSKQTISVKIWNTTTEAYAEADGDVLVWDPIAGHYTRCYGLSARVQARIRREATNAQPLMMAPNAEPKFPRGSRAKEGTK